MEAVASEQNAFDVLLKNPEFLAQVPSLEQRPVLRTVWSDKSGHLLPPLETVRYAGKTYQITDPVADALDPTERWNRDTFRLMVGLGSQVTVDISKFQRQVLELQQ
jgi:hypothetical protein